MAVGETVISADDEDDDCRNEIKFKKSISNSVLFSFLFLLTSFPVINLQIMRNFLVSFLFMYRQQR